MVEIYCTNLPGNRCGSHDAVRVGIQRGQEVIDDVPGDSLEVMFRFLLRVKLESETGKPNFLGPYAFGTIEQRFLYICWGERIAGAWVGFRRAKIQMNHFSLECIENAIISGKPIKVSINMTDMKGGPICGTIKADDLSWT